MLHVCVRRCAFNVCVCVCVCTVCVLNGYCGIIRDQQFPLHFTIYPLWCFFFLLHQKPLVYLTHFIHVKLILMRTLGSDNVPTVPPYTITLASVLINRPPPDGGATSAYQIICSALLHTSVCVCVCVWVECAGRSIKWFTWGEGLHWPFSQCNYFDLPVFQRNSKCFTAGGRH